MNFKTNNILSENNVYDPSSKTTSVRKITRNISFMAIFLSIFPLLTACSDAPETANLNNLEQVREKGAKVMPFELDKTLHTFEKTADGGVQIVTIRKDADTDQLIPIREHLKKIANDFVNGNFGDPTTIHGSDMAGLSTLQANPSKFSITYAELENGAKLLYRSTDAEIISALHLWFDAQLTDHGPDATDNSSHTINNFSQDHICQTHPETCGK